MAVDELREEVKAQLIPNRGDSEQQQEETKQRVGKVAADLEEWTRQLNTFKPASADAMGGLQENCLKKCLKKCQFQNKALNCYLNLWKN